MSITSRRDWLSPRLSQPRLKRPRTEGALAEWFRSRIPEGTQLGEPILIVTHLVENRLTSCSITHGTHGDFLITKAYLGRLDKKPFVAVRKGMLRFGTSKHIWMHDSQSGWEEKRALELPLNPFGSTSLLLVDIDSPLPKDQEAHLGMRDLKRHGEYLKQRNAGAHPGIYPLEFVVGHAPIQTYCLERGEQFMSMYLALWRDLADAPKLPQEFRRQELGERERIANQILLAWERVCRLDTKIQSVAQARGVLVEDGALTVCETEDDAFWISLGSRQRRSEEAQSLRRFIQSARLLKMDRIPHTLQLLVPGMSVDVPTLIKGVSLALEESKL